MTHDSVHIRDLFDRFCLAIDNPDHVLSGKLYSECFVEDGIYVSEAFGGKTQGRENLAKLITGLHHGGAINGKRHMTGPADIKVDGDHATAFSYYYVFEASPNKLPALIATGTYTDKLQKVKGHWLLTHREHTVDPTYFELAKQQGWTK